MSERKVLNKYYPPDFDPSKIPRMKLPKNRQYTVRLMAPFNMRCKTCGEYIYKGKKFNARKEDVENEDYFGIRIYRFYIKCTRCLQEISFKTDPRNTDYEIEAGATRNFMALKLAEEQALREEEEAKEEEASNPMKLLENRTKQSKNEIELLESLEELKDLNRRQEAVDYDTMLSAYDTRISEREREEKMKQMDEEFIKTIKFQNTQKRKIVVEEEIVDEDEVEVPSMKILKESTPSSSRVSGSTTITSSHELSHKSTPGLSTSVGKSIGRLPNKSILKGLVKIKKSSCDSATEASNSKEQRTSAAATVPKSEDVPKTNLKDVHSSSTQDVPKQSALSLLGAYSDTDSSEND